MYTHGNLKRHSKPNNVPYEIGSMAGILAFLILDVFSLSIVDNYLLHSNSLASVISAVLVDLANGDRSGNSLGGLAINPVLSAAAQAKADDMAAKGYFAHVSPDGVDSWYWFRQQGYTFLYAGENLAVDFSDSVDVERAWMNSPTHRANILNGHFTEIGIATAQGYFQGHPTTFVVQMFGAPSTSPKASKSTAPSVVQTVTMPTEPTAPSLATTVTPAPKAATVAVVATNTAVTNQVLGTEAGSILPAQASPVKNLISNGASWWQHLLASPKTMLKYAYYALALAILVILAYVTELEFHRRHRHHVIAAALLLALMAGLLTIAHFIFFAQPVIIALQ